MTLPRSMKAWRYASASGGLEKNLEAIFDAELPPHDELKSGQIIVRVYAAALNPVDYKMVEMPVVGSRMVKLPATPGKDFAGVVVKTSTAGNSSFREGQRVFGRLAGQPKYGALGEYIIVDLEHDACVALPDNVTNEAGASFGTAGTAAIQSIKPFLPSQGGAVFINGGSAGTGTFGLQFAKVLRAKDIVTTCSAANIDFCKSLGATECIDYRSADVIKELKKKGPIFDVVVDFIGTPSDLYKQSHHFLKPEGQFIQIAATPNATGIMNLLSAQYQPSFLGGGTRKYAFLRSQNIEEDFELVAKWMQDGQVEAVIDSVFKWEDVVEAYQKLKSGRAKGKIIVKGPTP